MPPTLRHTLRLAIASLILAAPQHATPAAAVTVTFTGHPLLGLGLACPSTPSTTALDIAAGSTVTFVNATGKPATLWVGDDSRTLPDDTQVPVTFLAGPVTLVVRMLPQCAADIGRHVSMTVTVDAAAGPTPTPTVSRSDVPTAAPSVAVSSPHPTRAPAPSKTPRTSSAPRTPGSPPTGSSAVAGPVFGGVAQHGPRRASGLLVLIAVVGVAGVVAAAIRALIAERRVGPARRR